MSLSATQLLLLGGLGVTGVVVYSKFVAPKAAAQDMGEDLEQLTHEDVEETYAAAEASWQDRLEPTRTSSGHLLFKPLDLSERNPLSGYVAVVKEHNKNLYQLAQEKGDKLPTVLVQKGDRGKPYRDPAANIHFARVYFFNPSTGREVAAWELRKHADLWLPGMQEAVENTFVHAFNHACKVNGAYNQWNNSFRVNRGSPQPINCDVEYPVTM